MKFKNIYVICPYGLVTGGPDALHQLVYYMKNIGLNANIVYSDIKNNKYSIPNEYKCYVDEYLINKDIIDSEENVIIVPETLTNLLKKYKKIKKYVWWLSVQNDTNDTPINKIKKVIKKIFDIQNFKKLYKINTLKNLLHHHPYKFCDDDVIHLCASYYALDYVEKNNKEGLLLIEPISKYFLDNFNYNIEDKNEVVLYNPKKNFQFTKKIISKLPDVNFIPLRGFTQKELIEIYSKSKLYIDFGNFPGAERIPKEAVLNGCLVLTGRNGASDFYNDVVIPDKYKIDSSVENISKICDTIKYMLENYSNIIHDFEKYKNTVLNLEYNFIENIKKYFE